MKVACRLLSCLLCLLVGTAACAVSGAGPNRVRNFKYEVGEESAIIALAVNHLREGLFHGNNALFVIDERVFNELRESAGSVSSFIRPYNKDLDERIGRQKTSDKGPLYYRVVIFDFKRIGDEDHVSLSIYGGPENSIDIKLVLVRSQGQWRIAVGEILGVS